LLAKKGAHANAKLIIHEDPVGGLRLRGESGLCEDYLEKLIIGTGSSAT
jgi:hypothetical protein